MATTIGALRVELSANIAKFEQDMGKAAKHVGRVQRNFERFGSRATAAGQALSIGLTAPLVGIGAAALRSSVAFESAFAGVIKTVDDATDGMGRLTPVGEALQQGFRDLSLQIPIAATELAGIGEVAGQLGIESENILGFTEVMAKLGVTTNLSAEEAATSLAQLANITSLPQTEFERLGSTVVALGNNLATNEAQIVDFGKRIASAGTIAGLTEPQILAIGGAMASVGVESEAGGTAVQKVLNAMTKSVAQGGEKLEIFARTAGLSAAEFQRAFREDAAGAFASFVTGLGQQGDAAFTTLDGLTLGNERVVRSFLSLAAKSTTLTDALALGTTAWEENTALAREADIRFETTASQLKLLANQVVEAGRALGDILKPILQTVVGIVREQVVPWLKTIVDRFKALSPEVQQSRVLWFGFAAALGPALIALGGVARVLTPMLPLLSGVWRGAGRMSNAILMLIPNLRTAGASTAAFGARLKRLHLTNMARGFKLLGISSRGAGVGLRLAAVAAGGLRLAIRGVVRALGPLGVIWAAFEFAQWAAGALDLGGKLKRLLGITDDAAESAREADAAYEGLADTFAQTEVAAATRALDELERAHAALVERLDSLGGHNAKLRRNIREQIEALGQQIEAAREHVKTTQAAARASSDYADALAEATAEAARITEATGVEIQAARKLGRSMEDVATRFGLSTEALRIYLDALDKAPAGADRAGQGIHALTDEAKKAQDALEKQRREWTNTLEEMRFDEIARQRQFNEEQAKHELESRDAAGHAYLDKEREQYQAQQDASREHWKTISAINNEIGLKLMQQDAAAMQGVWSRLGESFAGFGAQIGQTFARALEGGGQWLGAMQSLGVQAGGRLGTFLSKGLTAKTGFLATGLGKVLGQAAGMAIPLVGPVIGSLVGKLFSFGGPSKAEQAGRKTAGAFRDGVIATLNDGQLAEASKAALGAWRGNERGAQFLIGVRDAYLSVGKSAAQAESAVTRLWRAEKRGPDAVAAVQRELQGVLDQAAALTQAERAIAVRNREIAASLSGIVEAGHAAFDPAQIDPYLAQLEELGLLTAAEAAALRQLADDAHTDWRAMEESAKHYGVAMKTVLDENGHEVQVFDESLLGLGHAQAKLTDEAGQLASAWSLLTGEGTHTQVAIEGMTDEAQGFVTQALEMGIALPEAMRPMLDAMVSQGRLTDENGDKLTDLSGITFAAPIAEGFDLLADKIQLLIITLGGPSGLSKAVEDMAASAGLEIKGLAGEWSAMTTEAQAAFGSFAAFVEDQALREIATEAGLNYDAIAAKWQTMTDAQKAAFGSFRTFITHEELKTLATDAGLTFDDLQQRWTEMTEAQQTAVGDFRAFVNQELDQIEDKTVTVTTRYVTEGAPDGGRHDDAEGFQHGSAFRQFGRGTPAMLHGLERVMTAGEGRGIHAALGRITGGLAAIADLSGVRALAEGGLVTRPTLALLGERGPEHVIPLDRMDEFGGGGRRVEAKLDQLNQNLLLLRDELRQGLDPRKTARALVAAVATS